MQPREFSVEDKINFYVKVLLSDTVVNALYPCTGKVTLPFAVSHTTEIKINHSKLIAFVPISSTFYIELQNISARVQMNGIFIRCYL